MPKYHLSASMVIKDKKNRVRVIIKPNLNADVLEKISISCNEFQLSVSKLQSLVFWAVDQRIEFYFIFKQYEMAILVSLYRNSS